MTCLFLKLRLLINTLQGPPCCVLHYVLLVISTWWKSTVHDTKLGRETKSTICCFFSKEAAWCLSGWYHLKSWRSHGVLWAVADLEKFTGKSVINVWLPRLANGLANYIVKKHHLFPGFQELTICIIMVLMKQYFEDITTWKVIRSEMFVLCYAIWYMMCDALRCVINVPFVMRYNLWLEHVKIVCTLSRE